MSGVPKDPDKNLVLSLGYSYDPDTGLIRNSRGKVLGNNTQRYTRICVSRAGRVLSAHRIAYLIHTGDWPKGEVDHINGDTHDNRWNNLRVTSRNMNSKNRRKYAGNSSGYKGVYTSSYKDSVYTHAKLQVDGASIYLGTFDSVVEAAKAYDKAAIKHFGEYASLNFGEV